jgi:hypothetical protein
MKRPLFKRFVLFFLLLLFLFSCDNEADIMPQAYPIVLMSGVVAENDGATFGAKIVDPGNKPFTEKGFVWGLTKKPTLTGCHSIVEPDPEKETNFDVKITSGLAKDTTYYVRAYIKTSIYTVYSNEVAFVSSGSLSPVINDFSPKAGSKGTEVRISGANFGYEGEPVVLMIGDKQATVKSLTNSEIVFNVPDFNESYKGYINLVIAGTKVTSASEFEIWYPWKKIANWSLDTYYPAYFTDQKLGYFIEANSNLIRVLDPTKPVWLSPIPMPLSSDNNPLATSYNNSAYILLGSKLVSYSPSTNLWQVLGTYPGSRSEIDYIFAVKNKVHIGSILSGKLYAFDLSSAIWTEKTGRSNNYYAVQGYCNAGEVINDVAYLFVSGGMSSYNPATDSWSYYYFSGGSYWGCFFSIGDKIFSGLGEGSEAYVDNKMYSYNTSTGVAEQLKSCPKGMMSKVSLSINGKGYIFSRYGAWWTELNELWEFDPAHN